MIEKQIISFLTLKGIVLGIIAIVFCINSLYIIPIFDILGIMQPEIR